MLGTSNLAQFLSNVSCHDKNRVLILSNVPCRNKMEDSDLSNTTCTDKIGFPNLSNTTCGDKNSVPNLSNTTCGDKNGVPNGSNLKRYSLSENVSTVCGSWRRFLSLLWTFFILINYETRGYGSGRIIKSRYFQILQKFVILHRISKNATACHY